MDVPTPVPEDPSQFRDGVSVECRVTHVDFEKELHCFASLSLAAGNASSTEPTPSSEARQHDEVRTGVDRAYTIKRSGIFPDDRDGAGWDA